MRELGEELTAQHFDVGFRVSIDHIIPTAGVIKVLNALSCANSHLWHAKMEAKMASLIHNQILFLYLF